MSYMPSYHSMNVPVTCNPPAKFAETLTQVSPWDQNARALRKRLAVGELPRHQHSRL